MRGKRAAGDAGVEFERAVSALRESRLRPEVHLTEVPAPGRIAPYAVAMTADVIAPGVSTLGEDTGDELATGRFVLLHDPSAPEPWEGRWRAVTFARAALEPEVATDPLLGAVGWSWLIDSLDSHGLGYVAAAGTVTRVVSESFGALDDRESSVEMEVRASWTPSDGNIGGHLQAWSTLLCTIAGLPPLPEGVVALPGPRR